MRFLTRTECFDVIKLQFIPVKKVIIVLVLIQTVTDRISCTDRFGRISGQLCPIWYPAKNLESFLLPALPSPEKADRPEHCCLAMFNLYQGKSEDVPLTLQVISLTGHFDLFY